MSRRGLGKGLGALLPELGEGERPGAHEIEIRRIKANPRQPRRHFDAQRLEELAQSIREHGVVQPLVVRPVAEGFELVAGERRWRAAGMAGLAVVPAVVRELSDAQVVEIALIENLQREDLNPIEEAQGFRRLIEEFGLSQEDLARRLGKSRPQVSNTLRLLNLSSGLQEQVAGGQLSVGHAKVLLSLESLRAQEELALKVVAKNLSVRQTEEAARGLALRAAKGAAEAVAAAGAPRRQTGAGGRDPELASLEGRLRARLGTPVTIISGQPKGRVEIAFFGAADLGRIIEVLLGPGA